MRIAYLMAAFALAGLGMVGIFLPLLPTVPLWLAAAFFFARGSPRWHRWFTGTGLYKRYLESYLQSRSMTLGAKLGILLPVSAMLAFACLLVNHPAMYAGMGILLAVKYYYFLFRIATVPKGGAASGHDAHGRPRKNLDNGGQADG